MNGSHGLPQAKKAARATNVATIPSAKAASSLCSHKYFGSDLWRLRSKWCGPCEFATFSITYGRDCESGALRNRDAGYTPFAESATRPTRLSALKLRRQLHMSRRRLRSRTGTLWCARCWVSDARLLLVSSTASSPMLGANSPGRTMTARRNSIGDLAR